MGLLHVDRHTQGNAIVADAWQAHLLLYLLLLQLWRLVLYLLQHNLRSTLAPPGTAAVL